MRARSRLDASPSRRGSSRSAFFVVWELVCRVFDVSSFVLPSPTAVLAAIFEYRSQLAYHGAHTLWMTLAGFLLAVVFGLLLGMALGASRS